MSRLRGVLVSVLIFWGNSAFSADIISVPQGIYFEGEIVEGDFNKIVNLSRNLPQKNFYLNSGGGQVSEALKIGEFIRNNGFATNLPPESLCASACVIIFAGGVIRTADQTSKIVVHVGSGILNSEMLINFEAAIYEYGAVGASIIASMFEQLAAQITLEQVIYFLKSGISLELLELTFNVHHLESYELTYKEAIKFNLINSY